MPISQEQVSKIVKALNSKGDVEGWELASEKLTAKATPTNLLRRQRSNQDGSPVKIIVYKGATPSALTVQIWNKLGNDRPDVTANITDGGDVISSSGNNPDLVITWINQLANSID